MDILTWATQPPIPEVEYLLFRDWPESDAVVLVRVLGEHHLDGDRVRLLCTRPGTPDVVGAGICTATIDKHTPLPIRYAEGGVWDDEDAARQVVLGSRRGAGGGLPTGKSAREKLARIREVLDDNDDPRISTGTILFDRQHGTHYTVVRTTEGEPVLRPSTVGEL